MHNFTANRKKTWPILLRRTLKHVMFLQKCKRTSIFCEHNIWQKMCFQPSCLVMRLSQFGELSGLQYIAVSWPIYNSSFLPFHLKYLHVLVMLSGIIGQWWGKYLLFPC